MLKPESTDRRRLQRIHLLEPLPGRIRGKNVHILDVSLRGVRVAHGEVLGPVGEDCELSFDWNGAPVILDCRIRRSAVQRIGKASYARTLYHSGLEVRPSGRSLEGLRELIESHVERALREQRSNARGVPSAPASPAREAAPSDLMRHEFMNGSWRSYATSDRHQPVNGFTIAANHSPVEVQMLRKAYAVGDDSAREAIRKIAALSLEAEEGVATARYDP